MSEYIKRSDVLDNIAIGRSVYPDCKKAFDGMEVEVNRFPAEDVQPVWHGEWINKTMSVQNGHGQTYSKYGCSVCKQKIRWRTNFCPNCGAKMDGGT